MEKIANHLQMFELGGACPAADVPADWKPAKTGFAFKPPVVPVTKKVVAIESK